MPRRATDRSRTGRTPGDLPFSPLVVEIEVQVDAAEIGQVHLVGGRVVEQRSDPDIDRRTFPL